MLTDWSVTVKKMNNLNLRDIGGPHFKVQQQVLLTDKLPLDNSNFTLQSHSS